MGKKIIVREKSVLTKDMWFIIDALGVEVIESKYIPHGELYVFDEEQYDKNITDLNIRMELFS